MMILRVNFQRKTLLKVTLSTTTKPIGSHFVVSAMKVTYKNAEGPQYTAMPQRTHVVAALSTISI